MDIVRGDLLEWASLSHDDVSLDPEGVAMNDRGIVAGQILSPDYARKIGSQLILQADLYDAIKEGPGQ